MGAVSSDRPASSGAERDHAAELYAQARDLHERKAYQEAREHYEQSLRLHEDEAVRAAYLRLLATIGPL